MKIDLYPKLLKSLLKFKFGTQTKTCKVLYIKYLNLHRVKEQRVFTKNNNKNTNLHTAYLWAYTIDVTE